MAQQLPAQPAHVQTRGGLPAAREGFQLGHQAALALLGGTQLGPQGVGRVAAANLFDQRAHPGLEQRQLGADGGLPVAGLVGGLPQPVQGRLDGALEQAVVEGLGDRIEHDAIEPLLPDQERVAAHRRPALVVVVAAVEAPALPGLLVVAGEGDERAATGRARGEARKQVLLLVGSVAGPAAPHGAGRLEPALCGLPERLGHDPQLGGLEPNPGGLRAREVSLHAPPIALPLATPHDLAAVERAPEDLAHGRRCPAVRPPRRRHAVGIERLRDPGEAEALGREREDAAHHVGLRVVDVPGDVRALPVGAEHLEVVVAVHLPAGHLAGARPALEGVIGALARALAFHLVGEGGHTQQQLVGRRVDGALAVLEVQEHAHAGLRELLHGVPDLDRFAAEARLLAHHEHLKRRARPERIQQPREAGPAVAEFGPGDAVVHVDMLGRDGPAFARGIGAGALELARDGFRLVSDVLIR